MRASIDTNIYPLHEATSFLSLIPIKPFDILYTDVRAWEKMRCRSSLRGSVLLALARGIVGTICRSVRGAFIDVVGVL